MVRLVGLSLVFAVLLNALANLTVVLNYEVNKKYIISHFCINKSKPKLHCNGKCYMMRKMKQQEEQEKAPAGNSIVEKIQIQLFFEKDFLFEPLPATSVTCSPAYQQHFISRSYYPLIFHPPTA